MLPAAAVLPDLLVGLGGLIVPPAVDFLKKKFLKPENDTPEATMSSLATTKPEVLPDYVTAVTGMLKARVDFFNRDVIGSPSQWVVNLRAAIRPVGVILSFAILAALAVLAITNETALYDANAATFFPDVITGVRLTCELIVSSWFGSRITINQ